LAKVRMNCLVSVDYRCMIYSNVEHTLIVGT
jgi:hypothetical protein